MIVYLLAPLGGILAGTILLHADASWDRRTRKMLETPPESCEDPEAHDGMVRRYAGEKLNHHISWLLVVFFVGVFLFRLGKTVVGL